MKKLILVLAIALMASPVFALSVFLHREGTSTIIDVNYMGADPCNLPRAFAMGITIDNPGRIVDVNNFLRTGESNSVKPGFGIFPARVDINSSGVVQVWGTPLADSGDPGTSGSGLNTNKVVLEFASLYYGDVNAPGTNGKLCTLTINPGTATSSMNIRALGETTFRGGVVLENGAQFALDANTLYRIAAPDCFSTADLKYAQWVLQTKPRAWCCARQGLGDATGDGKVNASDLLRLRQAWGGIWPAALYDCRADFNHDGKINASDLLKLRQNWGSTGAACQADWKDNCSN